MARNYKALTGAQRLLAADVARTLIAAPIAGHSVKLFRLRATTKIAAAQPVEVAPSAGASATNTPMTIPSNFAGFMEAVFDEGFELPAATGLVATPLAAGPEIQFTFEYSIVPVNSGIA